MYKLISSRGQRAYDVNTYVCDRVTDLYRIRGFNMGDRCYVIYEYATYIVDSSGNWVKMRIGSGTVTPDDPTAMTSVFGEGIMGDIIFGEE
jgi:hypothetical protein